MSLPPSQLVGAGLERSAAPEGERCTVDAVVRAARPDGTVELELQPLERCAGCAGMCMWGRSGPRTLTAFCSDATLGSGMPVRISLSARRLLMGSLLLHGLPLASVLLGAAAGAFVTSGSDLGSLTGAAAALLLMFTVTPRLRRKIERATLAGVGFEPMR